MKNSKLDNWCILPTTMGEFRMYDTGDEGVRVVCIGDFHEQGRNPLLRLHSSCLASEVFDALDCDCADQLRESMKLIANEGRGVIIHLHQEGRGQGLSKKIEAVHTMQHKGFDTVDAFEMLGLEQDIRCYQKAVDLLRAVNINEVRLISNNPAKARFLQQQDLRVEMVNTHPTVRSENAEYLKTKKARLDHCMVLEVPDTSEGEVCFYHSDQPWGELSNFSQHSVFLFGKIWPTVEHFYQAQKYAGTKGEELIRCSSTPTQAKRRAKELNNSRRHDWDEIKEEFMLEGLRAKFGQHPDLRERLLGTKDRPLVEHTEHDSYWADAGDGTGLNRLGHLLMQVREEFQRLPLGREGST